MIFVIRGSLKAKRKIIVKTCILTWNQIDPSTTVRKGLKLLQCHKFYEIIPTLSSSVELIYIILVIYVFNLIYGNSN